MNMIRSGIQVSSISAFGCQNFKQLCSDQKEKSGQGVITTTDNGRSYDVTWDADENTISVKRDLTDVDGWTRFTEVLERLSHFETMSNAQKLENQLSIQRHNVRLAEPFQPKVKALLTNIEKIHTCVEPAHFPTKSLQEDIEQVSMPLTCLLEEMKQRLYEQAQHLSLAINEELASNQLWTKKQNTKSAIDHLSGQVQQLDIFINPIRETVLLYSFALGAVDVTRNSLIYDAMFTRLTSVATQLSMMTTHYFDQHGRVTKAEIHSYNSLIENEKVIAKAFTQRQLDTHFCYNELLTPPRYQHATAKDAHSQAQVEFNYQTNITALTNCLIDPSKTLIDFQNVADGVSAARERWRKQIGLEEEISHLLKQIQKDRSKAAHYPVCILHLQKLTELQSQLYNNGELLSQGSLELLQSGYHNILRANKLCLEISQFLESTLPGFVSLWKTSSYNDEMQSRILHLTVLKGMCLAEESLSDKVMDHMERFARVHKTEIQFWVDSSAFSRFTFYDPISPDSDYPTWLVKEHQLFRQKTREITKTLWETKYQALRNAELLQARGQLLEKVEKQSEILAEDAEKLADAAKKLHREHSLTTKVLHFFGLT